MISHDLGNIIRRYNNWFSLIILTIRWNDLVLIYQIELILIDAFIVPPITLTI